MEAIKRIGNLVAHHPVILFAKGDACQPRNRDSETAIDCLSECLDSVLIIDVTSDPEIRAFLPKWSDEQHIPQLYINGEIVGDIDVIRELSDSGVLQQMIDTAVSGPTQLAS